VVTIFPLPVSLLLLLFVQCASPHSPHWVTADASAAGVAGKSDVGLNTAQGGTIVHSASFSPINYFQQLRENVPRLARYYHPSSIMRRARQSLADWIAMRKQAMRFSRVWVTILTEENDMPGVVALSESLVRTGSIFPLTVLVSQRINATLRNQLYRHPGVGHVIEMEDLSPATDNENWGLLHAFGLTQYSAVCVLSPKTLVFRNMDDLLLFQLADRGDTNAAAAAAAASCSPPSSSSPLLPPLSTFLTSSALSSPSPSSSFSSGRGGRKGRRRRRMLGGTEDHTAPHPDRPPARVAAVPLCTCGQGNRQAWLCPYCPPRKPGGG